MRTKRECVYPVEWRSKRRGDVKKWIVRVTNRGVREYLGIFSTKKEAQKELERWKKK